MRGCLQHDENDCGLACILTICKFLKISVDESSLRKNIFMGSEGLSLYGITEVFNNIGIESLAVEGTNTELFTLLTEEKKPIIIMINEDKEYHYVVIYKQNVKNVFLWDPNKGKRIVSKEYFNLIWSGYAVYITEVLEHEKGVVIGKSVCWSALLQQKKCLTLLMIFSIILIAVSMSTTFVYKNIIEQIEMGIRALTPQLKRLFMAMGICYLIITILFIVKGILIAYLKKELEITLQNQFLKSLLNIPIQKKEDYTSGGILDRYYRLSVVVETMSSVFSSVVLECISLIAGIIILASISTTMFGMVLYIVVFYLVSFLVSKKKLFKLSKTIMDKESLLITHIKETIENLVSLKSFANSMYKNKIENEIKFVKNQEYTMNKISINMEGILDAIENLVMLLVLVYGINSVIVGNMSLGTLLAFESFVGFFLSPAKNLLGILPSLQETILTFLRVEDIFVYDEPMGIIEHNGLINGKVCVDDLDVAYGYDKPILKNISFSIGAGDKVFLMGASGCGKSTLAKSLAGIVKHKKGRIIWDNGINSDNIDLSKQVLYLSQEAEIFSGSIKDNILMWEKKYDKILFDEVIEALGINQMMNSRGLDLESYLCENGTNLSGGEKQRIALARAIMTNSPVYIFDEATCHLDSESERVIMDYIRKKSTKHTCIIILHNANLLNANDNVIFIDGTGKLHKDTHLQMLKNNVEYNRMIKFR